MNIHVLTVPNEEIKLRKGFTGADWWFDENSDLQVRVASELDDWRERAALALHETAEALMCKHLGITVEMVDEFDSKYKAEHDVDLNSGDTPGCCYEFPHTFATAIERIFTGVVGLHWKPYDDRLSVI